MWDTYFNHYQCNILNSPLRGASTCSGRKVRNSAQERVCRLRSSVIAYVVVTFTHTHTHAQASPSCMPVASRGASGSELSPKQSVLDRVNIDDRWAINHELREYINDLATCRNRNFNSTSCDSTSVYINDRQRSARLRDYVAFTYRNAILAEISNRQSQKYCTDTCWIY